MKLPSRPKLVYVERKDDRRRFAVVPYRAALDKSLSMAQYRTLIHFCGYCNNNGYALVALSTMAHELGISAQSVNYHMMRLERKGYIETLRKGYTNLRGALRRVLYEPKLTQLEQVSIANNNIVEVYDMAKHIQKRSKPGKSAAVDDSRLSYDDAILVVSHSLKTESDLLKLERLVSSGVSRSQLLAAFTEGA